MLYLNAKIEKLINFINLCKHPYIIILSLTYLFDMKTSIFSIIAFISSVCLCAGATSLSGSVSGEQTLTQDSIVNKGDTYSVKSTVVQL